MSSSTTMRRIVIDDATPYAHDLFGDLGECTLLPGRKITPDSVKTADALIVRSRTQVNAALLAGSRVKFVGSTVVGLDHVDQAWLKQAGIQFYSAQGCNSTAVAEYVIHNMVQWAAETHMSLEGKTLAIIGVGHVGSKVWQKAQALGLRCLLNDPPRARAEKDFPHTALSTCLREADFITLHTPLTQDGIDATYHLLNAENLSLIKPTAVLINAARGGIVDETAWLQTETAADIIDCWENEPHINPALLQRAWRATPHIAGHSLDAKVRGGIMVSQALRRFWQAPELNEHAIFNQLPSAAPLECSNYALDPLHLLADLLCQSYDFQQDDVILRTAPASQLAETFETYRRAYPIRREWHAHHLPKTCPKNFYNMLISLEFST